MEVTHIIFKYSTLILLLCYAVSAKCSTKGYIDENKNKAVFAPLPEQTISTNISLSYDAKGLQPLFNLANSFMNNVQPKNFGEVFKNDDIAKLFGSEWKKLIMDYEIPILVTVGIGLLFFLLMPIVGCCFCMCRCCDRCGGDMKQSEKKAQQHCKVALMVFFLFAFTVLMLCGVLFMFVTNNRLHEASNEVVATYDSAIQEAKNMVEVVKQDVITLTTDQLVCVVELVWDEMTDTKIIKVIGQPLLNHVWQNVGGVFGVAIKMSTNIDAIFTTLNEVDLMEKTFNSRVDTLKSSLDSADNTLTKLINDCNNKPLVKASGACTQLESINLDINMNFSSIPKLGKHKAEIQDIKDKNLTATIIKANVTVQDIPQTVIEKSNASIYEIKEKLNSTQESINTKGKNITDDIEKEVEKIEKTVSDKDDSDVYKTLNDERTKKYEAIRWKVYVALSAVMAFIVFLLFCGVACGSCGYNKEYMPTERSATANCGGNLLMAAVGLMFMFSFIFMIFCVIWFFVGMHIHVVCRELKNAELIDNLVITRLKGDMRNLSAETIIGNCRENVALYRADPYIAEKFNISKKFNLSVLDDVNAKIEKDIKFDLKDLTILSPDAEAALEEMSNSSVNTINFTEFHNALNKPIMAANITEIVNNLTKLAANIPDQGMKARINELANNLTELERNTIAPMKRDIKEKLTVSVTKLEDEVQPISGDATELLVKLKAAENFLQNETPDFIKERVLAFARPLISIIKEGVKHILTQVKDNVGRCKPVANIYDGVINTFLCDNIVQNSNGFWLALGWCLLFFIPSIILSVKLAKYFRKMDYSTGMDTIVVDHPPYNDKIPHHNAPYTTPGYSHDIRAPPPYTSTQHNNPGYQHA